MEIKIGNLKLTAEDRGNKSTIIRISNDDSSKHVLEVDSKELKAAIEALDKT